MKKEKMIKIKLVRSVIGVRRSHKETIRGLALRKINSEVTHVDTPSIQGMIKKVSYLIEVIN
jgi:large subunit ribosomal protein L30